MKAELRKIHPELDNVGLIKKIIEFSSAEKIMKGNKHGISETSGRESASNSKEV